MRWWVQSCNDVAWNDKVQEGYEGLYERVCQFWVVEEVEEEVQLNFII